MYRYIGETSVYDIIGIIDLLIFMITNYFIFNNSELFIGNTAKFLISYSSKSPVNNSFTRILSSEKFWKRFEKTTVYIIWLLGYLFAKDFSIKILRIGNDYYGIVILSFLLLLIVAYNFRLDILKLFDFITPYFALHSFILKFCCFFNGCCSGYECSFGFYNQDTELVEFPVQLLEGFQSLLLFFILLFLRKRSRKHDGMLFPFFFVTYSLNRFFAGFFRADDKVFLFLTDYQLTSLSCFLIGILIIFLFLKFNKKVTALLNREAFPGYMKYKRSISAAHNVTNKKKSR